MAYTTINKSTDYFNTKLYTGNGGTQSITGVGFQPDFTWIKGRSGTYGAVDHMLFDAVRGATKEIRSNTTSAEDANATTLTSFNSDGFSLSTKTNVNGSSTEYASWNWKANGAGSANTTGSINSTVSVNTTSGFSIVKFTGTGANATVGHGLGSAPKFIFGKNASVGTSAWAVYSSVLGATKYLNINTNSGEGTFSGYWNNTNPTSSLISIGSHGDVNGVGDNIIYYCFAEKKGYSKFGSYTGNQNADGTFIYTGFKPAFVIRKKINGNGNWIMQDSKRPSSQPFNEKRGEISGNTTSAETSSQYYIIDFLSNGFKNRTADSEVNGNGGEYIYMAFAEAPLVGSNNVPCTAR